MLWRTVWQLAGLRILARRTAPQTARWRGRSAAWWRRTIRGAGRSSGGPMEEVLPAELSVGAGIFHRKGVGEIDPAMAFVEVLLTEEPDPLDLLP